MIMDSCNSNLDDINNPAYWKKNPRAVPGRGSPRKEVKVHSYNSISGPSSFQDFQQSVSDAWDLDDDEFCRVSSFDNDSAKIQKFRVLLRAPVLNMSELQKLSWPGIPFRIRGEVWRLLCGYSPPVLEERVATLKNKRMEYWNYVKEYYDAETRDESYQGTYRQIHIDIPRMSPSISLLRQKVVQDMFERILFVWSVRHPASGYVQGINDLVTPFYIVFLLQFVSVGLNLDAIDVSALKQEERDIIEADSYWCLSRFLRVIQDNYIFPQIGIQEKINQLKKLIQRIDPELHEHIKSNEVEYLQFSFRWMNNLLTRELPVHCIIRLWDTYLAEIDAFPSFQLFVCAAFLLRWRSELLKQTEFQNLMILLQNLPTQSWDHTDIALLVADAYKLKYTFADTPNHLIQCKDS